MEDVVKIFFLLVYLIFKCIPVNQIQFIYGISGSANAVGYPDIDTMHIIINIYCILYLKAANEYTWKFKKKNITYGLPFQ